MRLEDIRKQFPNLTNEESFKLYKSMKKSEAHIIAGEAIAEIGKTISKANGKALSAAIKAMKAAMDTIAPLIAEDADDEVATESNVIMDHEIDPILKLEETKYQKWELVPLGEVAKILSQDDSYDATRQMVQQALRKRAISDSLTQKVASGMMAGYDDYYDYGCMPYIRDLYDGYVVYCIDGKLYQCEYTISNDLVTLTDPTSVEISYVPTATQTEEKKTIDVVGDLITLQEKAIKDDGTARIKLISPGWGSSGYYSRQMLERDGTKAFPKGTHMYMNHPTEEEDRIRPERDVRDLAGVQTTDAVWESKTPTNTGEGLYANVKVFPTYAEFLDAAAPYIGVSIRASGIATEGEAEKRHGLIIDSLEEGFSVDYVTMAGRGGEILPLYESARSKVIVESKTKTVEGINVDITPEELASLRENATKTSALETQLVETNTALTKANSIIARMQEGMLLAEAGSIVSSELVSINIPDITRKRLTVECVKNVPLKEDNTLDTDKLRENVKAAALAEMQYLESVTGRVTGGVVKGITSPEAVELTQESVDTELNSAFANWGLSESGQKIASRGRIN